MSARDELALVLANAQRVRNGSSTLPSADHASRLAFDDADAILAAGYSKPRTITTAHQLETLPFGSAVQTSDESDTVVLRCEGANFRNQSGADLSATDLWRYGTHPFTLIYSPEES